MNPCRNVSIVTLCTKYRTNIIDAIVVLKKVYFNDIHTMFSFQKQEYHTHEAEERGHTE